MSRPNSIRFPRGSFTGPPPPELPPIPRTFPTISGNHERKIKWAEQVRGNAWHDIQTHANQQAKDAKTDYDLSRVWDFALRLLFWTTDPDFWLDRKADRGRDIAEAMVADKRFRRAVEGWQAGCDDELDSDWNRIQGTLDD